MEEEKNKYIRKIRGNQARIGERFHKEISKIQGSRLVNGKSKDRISMEKITNMIARHDLWRKISEDIIKAEEEDINTYGK